MIRLPWQGYEPASGVGGLWDIDAPRSTVYESAHLISSRTTTEFTEFPNGPEQTRFLKHRPALDNTRLREVFGHPPRHTSAEAFDAWLAAHPEAHA